MAWPRIRRALRELALMVAAWVFLGLAVAMLLPPVLSVCAQWAEVLADRWGGAVPSAVAFAVYLAICVWRHRAVVVLDAVWFGVLAWGLHETFLSHLSAFKACG